jgi:hypothetical protein
MIIRNYEKDDEVQITKLFSEVFNQTMNVEHWRWKYEGQGSANKKSVIATNKDGKVVGHFGGIPLRMWFRDQLSIGYQGVDVMVHKQYRGLPNRRGLYFNICRVFYENLPAFVYGFSNLDHLRLGILLGFFEKAIVVYDVVIQATKHPVLFYELESMDWMDDRINELWNQVSQSLGWSIVRDTTFLKWRYGTHPLRSYKLYGLKKRFAGDIVGWIITKEGNVDELFLVDMLFKEPYLETLIKRTISMAYQQGRKKVVFWLNARYYGRLRSMGAQFLERGTYITNCVWVKMCESSEMEQKLYYTMGDSDFL